MRRLLNNVYVLILAMGEGVPIGGMSMFLLRLTKFRCITRYEIQ